MFGKLLKHELQATTRIIPIVYLVTICLLVVQIVLSGISNDSISAISFAILAITLVAQEIITLALVVWRFYRSMCADEGYLTHALPVRSSFVLLSKLLTGCLWGSTSRLLSVLGWIVLLTEELPDHTIPFFDRFPAAIRMVTDLLGIGEKDTPIVVAFFLVQILSIAFTLVMIYFAILVGKSPVFRRVGVFGIVLVGFLEYVAMQIISAISMIFIPLSLQLNIHDSKVSSIQIVTKRVGMSYFALTASPDTFETMPFPIGLGTWLVLPILILLMFFLTTYWMKRHTNLR